MKSIQQHCLSSNRVRSSRSYALLVGIVVAVAMVLIAMALWPDASHHKPRKQHQIEHALNWQQLAMNLDALQQPAESTAASKPHRILSVHEHADQRMQHMRMAAPTLVYQRHPLTRLASTDILRDKSAVANFVNQGSHVASVYLQHVRQPEATVVAGELIHAVLESAIDSNLPGMVRAVVAQPVYSFVGQHVLIPAGSRLIGQYQTAMALAQQRLMVVWTRVILANGDYIMLDSPSTDGLGRSGQAAASIDHHFWQRFGQASLLSIIGATTAVAGVSDQQQFNSLSQYRTQLAQGFQQSAQASLPNQTSIKSTIRLHQGAAINVFVARDLIFSHQLDLSP